MKINPRIGRSPSELEGIKFSAMKKYIKQDLKRLEKNTSKDSPTLFMMIGLYDYPDKKQVALPIVGRRSIDWKKHAKNIVAKDDTGVLGRVYFSGINSDGQKVVVMDIAKGKGKTKIAKLEKGLKKLIPQSTYQVVFNQIQESELDELENQFDSAGDVAEIEVPEEGEDDGEVEVDTNQSYTQLLASNLAKISAQFVPIRDNMKAKVNNDPEDVELLLDYAVEWLELYAEADPEAQTVVAAKVSQVEAIKAFAESQMADSSATPRQKMASFDAADKALAIGLEMAKAPEYQKGHAYIPFTGKATGTKYKKGDAILPADKASYNPTWCNQFAYDMTDKVVGNSSPFNMLPMGKSWTNANTLGQFAEAAEGVLFERLGKFEDAWAQANAGKIVYFLSKDKIGHVSTAAPTKPAQMVTKNGDKYGMVIQAGSSVGHMHMFKVWGDPVKSGVKIFLSRINGPLAGDGKIDPNIHLAIYNKITHNIGEGHIMGSIGTLQNQFKKPEELQNVIASIRTVQQLLVNAGQAVKVDGDCGGGTVKAIKNIQLQIQQPQTGFVAMGDATWNFLMGKSTALIEAAKATIPAAEAVTPNNNSDSTTPTLTPEQVTLTPAAGVAAIPAAKLAVLKEILAKAGETKATITSYSRTAEEQARIMYNNIIKDGEAKNKASYKNPAAAATVVDAFMTALKAGKNGQEIYAAVLSAVNKAGAANLSDHCGSNPAIDIDPASLKDAAKFEAALKADSRVKAVTPPNDPLYHLIIA
jgi:peptidoglycan hydrolase-like protein with peptidoglycan-binding domain